jgi:hypothetical protein
VKIPGKGKRIDKMSALHKLKIKLSARYLREELYGLQDAKAL